jgi:hypothetical protein
MPRPSTGAYMNTIEEGAIISIFDKNNCKREKYKLMKTQLISEKNQNLKSNEAMNQTTDCSR